MPITPLLGLFQFDYNPDKLPAAYSQTKTAEDRVARQAKIEQRLVAWSGLALEKINEIGEIVKTSGAADVSQLVVQLNTATADIVVLKAEQITQNEDIATAKSTATTANTKATAATTAANNANSGLTNLRAEVEANAASIDELIEGQEDTQGDVQALSTSVGGFGSRITAVENTSATTVTRITAAETKVNAAATEVEGFGDELASLSDSNTILSAKVAATETKVNTAVSTIDGYTGRINTVEGKVTTLTTTVTGVQTEVNNFADTLNTQAEDISTAVATVAGVGTRITTVESTVAELDTAVDANTTAIAGAVTNIGSNTGAISSLNVDVASLRDSLTATDDNATTLSQTVGNLQSTVSTHTTAIADLQANSGGGGGGGTGGAALVSGISQITQDAFGGKVQLPFRASAKRTVDTNGVYGETIHRATGFNYNPEDYFDKLFVVDNTANDPNIKDTLLYKIRTNITGKTQGQIDGRYWNGAVTGGLLVPVIADKDALNIEGSGAEPITLFYCGSRYSAFTDPSADFDLKLYYRKTVAVDTIPTATTYVVVPQDLLQTNSANRKTVGDNASVLRATVRNFDSADVTDLLRVVYVKGKYDGNTGGYIAGEARVYGSSTLDAILAENDPELAWSQGLSITVEFANVEIL